MKSKKDPCFLFYKRTNKRIVDAARARFGSVISGLVCKCLYPLAC